MAPFVNAHAARSPTAQALKAARGQAATRHCWHSYQDSLNDDHVQLRFVILNIIKHAADISCGMPWMLSVSIRYSFSAWFRDSGRWSRGLVAMMIPPRFSSRPISLSIIVSAG